MKKAYQTPVVERIEFDYQESVAACYSGGKHPVYGQSVYRDDNSGYKCDSSLTPDSACGYNGVHTSNVGYICKPH